MPAVKQTKPTYEIEQKIDPRGNHQYPFLAYFPEMVYAEPVLLWKISD